MDDETQVGSLGPLTVSVAQRELEQVVVLQGYHDHTFPDLLRFLGLQVQVQDGRCYVPRDAMTHQVLMELFEIVCALQYMRPHFGQLRLIP